MTCDFDYDDEDSTPSIEELHTHFTPYLDWAKGHRDYLISAKRKVPPHLTPAHLNKVREASFLVPTLKKTKLPPLLTLTDIEKWSLAAINERLTFLSDIEDSVVEGYYAVELVFETFKLDPLHTKASVGEWAEKIVRMQKEYEYSYRYVRDQKSFVRHYCFLREEDAHRKEKGIMPKSVP
jgi:hypothetical protein